MAELTSVSSHGNFDRHAMSPQTQVGNVFAQQDIGISTVHGCSISTPIALAHQRREGPKRYIWAAILVFGYNCVRCSSARNSFWLHSCCSAGPFLERCRTS